MSPLVLDDGYYPLLVVGFRSTLNDSQVEELRAFLEGFLERERRYSLLIYGAVTAGAGDAKQRRRMAEWQDQYAAAIRRCNVGTALVVKSALLRGAITALNWISRPPYESTTCATFGEGVSWCMGRLRGAGETIGPALMRFEADARAGLFEDGDWSERRRVNER